MKPHRLLFALTALLCSTVTSFANIGIPLQMQTGNPSGATADANNHTKYLIQRAQYAMDYNDTTHQPNWVAWNLTSGDIGGSGRAADFIVDTTLPSGFYRVLTTDYSGSGYDRGHMTPSADRTVTRADNDVTFFMSNMVPQTPDNNQGVWASFETYSRTLAAEGNELLITSGPSGFAGSTLSSGVAIPGYTWKVVVVVPLGAGTALSRIDANSRVIALKIPNLAGVRSTPWQTYTTSTAQIQADTGFTFFTNLNSSLAATLRTKVDGQTAAGTPAITAQPVAQTIAVGGTAAFSVAATSTTSTAFTYQWLRNDEPLTGNATATTAALTLTNIQAADFATYTVIVTNTVGSITSAGANLVITGLPPTIVTPPVAISRAAGTSAIFSVTASGSPTLAYQWRRGGTNLTDGANISGSGTATLTVANIQTADAVAYDVIVRNPVATAAPSAAATLTVTPAAPTITTQPTAAQTVVVADTVTLNVAATGSAPLSYRWRKHGVPLANGLNPTTGVTVTGASAAALILTGVAIADSGTYDVVVSNGIGADATSISSILNVNPVAPGSQVSYTGGTYRQNFDALPSTGTVTLSGTAPFDLSITPAAAPSLVGWRLAASAGTPSLLIGTGTATNGAAYSYGSTNATDRALGTVASGSVTPRFGVMITNNTPGTIPSFTVTYTGEQWRNGGNASLAAQTLPFGYSLNATDLNTGTFTDVPALGFTSPITSATAGALDGNTVANRAANLSATITGINWAPGQTLVLRWDDVNDAGNDHGLAVDDFTFTTPVAAPPLAPTIVRTTPANAASGVNGTSPITVTFNQPVTVAAGWFTLSSAANGALSATVTGGPTTYTITPPLSFSANDTVTVNFNAAQITASASGALHPTAHPTLTFATAAPVAPSINTAPIITAQPTAQVALVGGSVGFSVAATGPPAPTYQWRKDGAPLAGATDPSLALANLTAAQAGGYDVVVTNLVASVTSSLARLTINATPVAPIITRLPGNVIAIAGHSASFSIVATGAPALTYQWSKGATALTGATAASFTLAAVTTADVGTYTVTVTNSAGTTTASATLRVLARSYAGTYFGSLGTGGTCALRINDDNTGAFLAFLPSSATALVSRGVVVDDNGRFAFAASARTEGPPLAAANDLTFTGAISDTGSVSGSTSGPSVLSLSATQSPATGTATPSAGFYHAGAAGSSAQTLVIVSPTGQALVVTQHGPFVDGGTGTVDATGKVTVTSTGRSTISADVSADGALTATVTTSTGTTTTFTGFAANSTALAQQRIINLSTRTTAGIGDQAAIVGFVITGLESKPVLLRAVGPALRALGVTTALAAPRLDLRSSTALLATNTGWATAGHAAEIANAAARSGAFPLATGSADSVILTTLAPGTYSAVISAADAVPGVGLVELYDLSGGSLAQKLANLSTRAPVGSGEATLIAGLVIGGTAPKRVLLRAAGPSLAQFGVAGALARPALTVFSGTTSLAQNTGWAASTDAAALAEAAASVGAFTFGATSADAAVILNLAPGAYTAQVTGVAGATGLTLLEVYELP